MQQEGEHVVQSRTKRQIPDRLHVAVTVVTVNVTYISSDTASGQ